MKLLERIIELGISIELDGVEVLIEGESTYGTLEGKYVRTKVGLVDLVPENIVDIRNPTSTLDGFTLEQIETFLEKEGFGLVSLG